MGTPDRAPLRPTLLAELREALTKAQVRLRALESGEFEAPDRRGRVLDALEHAMARGYRVAAELREDHRRPG